MKTNTFPPAPSRLGARPPVAILGAAAAVAVAIVVTFSVVWSLRSESPQATPVVDQVAGTQTIDGENWSAWFASGRDLTVDTVTTLKWQLSPAVRILDSQSGATVAEVHVAYNPLALNRSSANQLLISDSPVDSAGNLVPRLLVFDLKPGLSLARTIALPNRSGYPVYPGPQALVLSADQRYLFYPARSHVDDALCRANDGDTRFCDRYGVGVVDLGTTTGTGSVINLPQGCGWAALRTSSATSAVATCASGDPFVIDASSKTASALAPAGAAPREKDPVLSGSAARARLSVPAGANGTATLFSDGTLRVSFPGQTTPSDLSPLPSGMRPLSGGADMLLAPDRLVVPYAGHYYDSEAKGLLVFDLKSLHVERTVPLSGIRSIVAVNADTLLLLATDGTVQRLNVTTGSATPVTGLKLDSQISDTELVP